MKHRITSGGVYKWETGQTKRIEYDFEPKDYSGPILGLGLALVIIIGIFIVTHWDTTSLLLK